MIFTAVRICRHKQTGKMVQHVGYAYDPIQGNTDSFHTALYTVDGALYALDRTMFDHQYETVAQFKTPEL